MPSHCCPHHLDPPHCAAGHVGGEFTSPIMHRTVIQNHYCSMGTSPNLCTLLHTIYQHQSCYGKRLLSTHGKDICICNHDVYVSLYLCQFCTYSITVVDPTIRLTWIEVNWSDDKVIRVKGRMIDLVCLVLLIIPHSNIHPRWTHAKQWAMRSRLPNCFCHRVSCLAHIAQLPPVGEALPRDMAFQRYAHNEHCPGHKWLNKNSCCI